MAWVWVWRTPFVMYRMARAHSGWRTLVNGAVVMALALSGGLASYGGGYVVTALGYPSLFLIGAGLMVVGTAIFWLYDWRQGAPAGSTPSRSGNEGAKP